MAGRQVTVGGNVRQIEPFNTRKVDAILDLAGRIGERYTQLLKAAADFERTYSEENPVRLTRDAVNERLAEAKAEQDPDAVKMCQRLLKQMGDGEYVERPGSPDAQMVIAAVAPEAMRLLRPELSYLLGLILIPREQLREAAKNGGIDQAVKDVGEDLYDETTPDEAIGILSAGVELFVEDVQTSRSRLGGLWATARTALFGETTESESGTVSESSPSTSSDAPITGRRKSSSMTSTTAKSAA